VATLAVQTQQNALPALVVVEDLDALEVDFFLMRSLRGLKIDGGGGGGAGGGGGGLSFCSATSNLFTKSTSETSRHRVKYDGNASTYTDVLIKRVDYRLGYERHK